jgi:predicted ATP-binding protein involved in virulence
MYIREVNITNIKSISHFKMTFPEGKEAGWHVLIGDNGAGKSTVSKAIAMGLLGPKDVLRLNPNWEFWVKQGKKKADITIKSVLPLKENVKHDIINTLNTLTTQLIIGKNESNSKFELQNFNTSLAEEGAFRYSGRKFGAGFGPYRRFTGGDPSSEKELKDTPLAPYLTLFREEIVLTATLAWIKDLRLRSLEKDDNAGKTLEGLKSLIAANDFLPGKLRIEKITADGVFFTNVNGAQIHINDLSDGVKSILSLTLELIRLLLEVFEVKEVFGAFSSAKQITVPGVVIVDEIDAHLHPSWQTRVGQWFTQHFPRLQFIVTTHSPLVCRACENGSIWRLAAPGTDQESGEITGDEKNTLIFGSVLDAYETDIFGSKISRGKEGKNKQKEYRDLVYKEKYGIDMSPKEKEQLQHLKKIFHTNVATEE